MGFLNMLVQSRYASSNIFDLKLQCELHKLTDPKDRMLTKALLLAFGPTIISPIWRSNQFTTNWQLHCYKENL